MRIAYGNQAIHKLINNSYHAIIPCQPTKWCNKKDVYLSEKKEIQS